MLSIIDYPDFSGIEAFSLMIEVEELILTFGEDMLLLSFGDFWEVTDFGGVSGDGYSLASIFSNSRLSLIKCFSECLFLMSNPKSSLDWGFVYSFDWFSSSSFSLSYFIGILPSTRNVAYLAYFLYILNKYSSLANLIL